MKAINEIEHFDYKDCVIEEAVIGKDIELKLTSLIVKASNSQNTNYTESYAGDTKAVFENVEILSFTKLGYKKYDANDVLIVEIPDEEQYNSETGINTYDSMDKFNQCLKKLLAGAYLTEIKLIEDGKYNVWIEIPDDDISAITDEYEILLRCGDITMSWDKYLNKVQSY